MWLSALISLVAGASPVEDLGAILQTEEGKRYRTAAVCSPLAPVLEPMGALLLLLGSSAEKHDAADFLALGRLLDPVEATLGGVALEGSLMFGSDVEGGPGMAAVPFSGSSEQAEALLSAAGAEAVPLPDGGWSLTAEEGHELQVQSAGSHLLFRRPASAPGEPRTPSPWLLRGLPDQAGCALFVDTPEGVLEGFPPTTAAALLPVDAQHDARVRLSAFGTLPPSFARQATAAVSVGSSRATPAAVVQINVPGLDVLRVPMLSAELGLGPEEHAALGTLLFIEPGSTIAGFDTLDAPQFAALMGVFKSSGRPFSAAGLNRRVVRLLREVGLPSQKLGRRAFAVDLGDTLIYGAADKGRLSVGTDPVVVAEALLGYGKPWVGPALNDFAQGRPVALSIHEEALPGGLLAGLQSTDRTWDLTVQTGRPAVEVLDTVVALVSPAYVGLRQQARSMEVQRLLLALGVAQEDHRARTGRYLALPPAPRPPGLLTANAVAWEGGAGWDDLVFAPDTVVRGSYWVEIDASGGVVVRGALDEDGDGEPSFWRLDPDGQVVREAD